MVIFLLAYGHTQGRFLLAAVNDRIVPLCGCRTVQQLIGRDETSESEICGL